MITVTEGPVVQVIQESDTQVSVRFETPTPEVLTINTGRPGSPGTPGAPGADGKSAYELAVENGFIGTEQAWLESLKGEPGDAGADGKSAYQIWLDLGNEGTEADFINSLKGEPGTYPDEEWTQVDMTNKIFNLFAGEYLNLGTGGDATMRYSRIGRLVKLKGTINFAADHGTGAVTIMDFDLPIAPRIPNPPEILAFTSEFAYAIFTETSPGANDGRLEPLGPAVSFFGGPAGITFTQLSRNDHDGQGGNVFRTDYPFDGTGRVFSIAFALNYEAAE